jgi:hypothetical protein
MRRSRAIRLAARRPQLPVQADECFEPFRHAKAIADRVAARGQFEQRPFGTLDLARRRIRQTADRLADRRTHIGIRFDFQTRRERRRCRVNDRGRRGRLAFRALRGLTNRGGGLGANLRQRMPQKRGDLDDERRPLQTSQRADAEPHRLRIAAVRARANDREVVGGRRAAIFGLENREACDLRQRWCSAHARNQPHG